MNPEKFLYFLRSVFIKIAGIFIEFIWSSRSYFSRLRVIISPFFTSPNIGLLLSIIGSIVIVNAVITTNPQVMSTAHGRWGSHSSIAYFYASLAKKEAIVGVVYLVTGFLLQIQGFPQIQLRLRWLLIIIIFGILFFAASFKVLPFCSARETLRTFIVDIKDKNTYIRAIAQDLKSVGVKNDIIEDILQVRPKHRSPLRENFTNNKSFAEEYNKTERMIRNEEWQLVKKLASRWYIEIDPNNIMERQQA